MNAPDPAFRETAIKDTLAATPRVGLLFHFGGGGNQGITTAQNLYEVQKRMPVPLTSLKPFVVGDSVGAFIAGALAAPAKDNPSQHRYHPSEIKDLYLNNVIALLDKDRALAYARLREIMGDATVSESLLPISISSANITSGKLKKGGFLHIPESYRNEHPDLTPLASIRETLLLVEAMSASSAVAPVIGAFRTSNGEQHMDMSLLEMHYEINQFARDFKAAYPDAKLIMVRFGNNETDPDVPQNMSMATALRRGLEYGRTYVNDQMEDLRRIAGFDEVIDLSIKVPNGTALPQLFSNKSGAIDFLKRWTERMIAQPDHQAKLDRLADVLEEAYFPTGFAGNGIERDYISHGPLADSLDQIPQYRPDPVIKPVIDMGAAFAKGAAGRMVPPAIASARWVGSWLSQTWATNAPKLGREWDRTLTFLMTGSRPPREDATQPSQTRSSEQSMPSESGYTPL